MTFIGVALHREARHWRFSTRRRRNDLPTRQFCGASHAQDSDGERPRQSKGCEVAPQLPSTDSTHHAQTHNLHSPSITMHVEISMLQATAFGYNLRPCQRLIWCSFSVARRALRVISSLGPGERDLVSYASCSCSSSRSSAECGACVPGSSAVRPASAVSLARAASSSRRERSDACRRMSSAAPAPGRPVGPVGVAMSSSGRNSVAQVSAGWKSGRKRQTAR